MTSVGGPGQTTHDLANRSFLRHRRVAFIKARAASDAIVVATVDPSGLDVGDFLTLLTLADNLKFRYGRRLTLTLNDDDAGGGLSVSVLIKGLRWGRPVSETLTVTSADTNDTVGTSLRVYDEIISIRVTANTSDSGDDLTMGWDGGTLGLPFPVDNLADVFSITMVDGGVEQTPIAVSSSSFDLPESALIGLTLNADDDYEVECLISTKDDGIGRNGGFA